jgi:hypothetical protein
MVKLVFGGCFGRGERKEKEERIEERRKEEGKEQRG